MIVDILYGIFFLALGYHLIKFRRQVKSWTGDFYWAEKYIGRGGTYFVILVLGMFFIFLGAIYPFGGMDLITGDGTVEDINILGN